MNLLVWSRSKKWGTNARDKFLKDREKKIPVCISKSTLNLHDKVYIIGFSVVL